MELCSPNPLIIFIVVFFSQLISIEGRLHLLEMQGVETNYLLRLLQFYHDRNLPSNPCRLVGQIKFLQQNNVQVLSPLLISCPMQRGQGYPYCRPMPGKLRQQKPAPALESLVTSHIQIQFFYCAHIQWKIQRYSVIIYTIYHLLNYIAKQSDYLYIYTCIFFSFHIQ